MDIWLNVFASVLGFSLTPIFILLFFDFAIRFISFISLKDSALISKIFLSIAKLISLVVLPTPENTILLGLIPAFSAIISSPTETTSAPNPNFLISLIILTFVLDLTAKQMSGEKDLKLFLKLLIFSFNLE